VQVYCSTYAGQTYAFWLMISTDLMYISYLAPIVAYKLYVSKTITQTMRDTVSWKVYMIMGLLDSLYDIGTSMSSPRVTGPVQNLLFQLPVPLSMLVSKIVWPKSCHYTRGKYVGSVILVIGSIVALWTQIFDGSTDDSNDATDANGNVIAPDNNFGAVIIYLLGVVFYTLSSVYKEYALKDAPTIDYYYLSLLENVWLLLFAFLFVPLLWIPGQRATRGGIMFSYSSLLFFRVFMSPLCSLSHRCSTHARVRCLGDLLFVGMGTDTAANTFPHFWGGAKCMLTGESEYDPNAQCGSILWLSLV
jgi:hypothetical protein